MSVSDRSTQVTPIGSGSGATSIPRDSQSFRTLSPDVQRDLYRRLAAVALTYSCAYTAACGTGILQDYLERQELLPFTNLAMALVSIGLGLFVFFAARNRKLPLRSFYNLVLGFQVLGAVGIMASAWGWQHYSDHYQHRVWDALGAPGTFPQDFVMRMKAAGLRLMLGGGVSWVGVWLLVFSSLLPTPPLRTLIGALLTAAVVPLFMLLSVWVGGSHESVQPWISSTVLDSSIDVFICAGIAIFGSKVVYKLTRDLSRAQQLGSYQLVEPIGSGGMGEVWRAKHRMLVRPAAVKLIRPQMLGGEDGSKMRDAVRRFEREAQATAVLRSPHTVELYDFGVTNEGTFYYVMELLDGLDLRTLVETFGPVPPERAIHLLRQTCHSLEDAHRSGLVHRDVKPANIFTCQRGIDWDFVKVLDFGLVKETVGNSDTADLTVDGLVRGTPAFMAPELASGGKTVDARVDLYALGCVGYWLVTGAVVFEAANPVITLLRHVRDEPVPPSERRGAPLPPGFEAVILACLEKDPARRPQTAAELAARLAALETEVEPWTSARAETWWRDHAAAMAARPRARSGSTAQTPALVAPGVRTSDAG
jgi:serine/threonine-protein kinase